MEGKNKYSVSKWLNIIWKYWEISVISNIMFVMYNVNEGKKIDI